jgi:hypothetical protein
VERGQSSKKPGRHLRSDISEGENVETNTDLQPKNSLWRKWRLTPTAVLMVKLTTNDWNPFERVDGKHLVALHKQLQKKNLKNYEYEDALL